MDKAIKNARQGDQMRDMIAEWSRQDMPGLFFTITEVSVSKESNRATVWFSALQKDELVKIYGMLKKYESSYARRLRKALNRPSIPPLRFAIDLRNDPSTSVAELLGKE